MSPTNSSIAYPAEAEAFWVGQAELVAEKLGDEALERIGRVRVVLAQRSEFSGAEHS